MIRWFIPSVIFLNPGLFNQLLMHKYGCKDKKWSWQNECKTVQLTGSVTEGNFYKNVYTELNSGKITVDKNMCDL